MEEQTGFLVTLENTGIGTAIREGATAFPWIESIHVLAVALVFGSIALVDLRLIGYGSHRNSVARLIKELVPVTWVGFALAVLTGGALFLSNASMYWDSVPFKLKMGALALAGANMMAFHFGGTYRAIAQWDETMPPPAAARRAGYLSLAIWTVVMFLGRWIGFSAPFV